ncbi:MAG TPA: MBL fold metallo-hydrolase [Candidatus Saccharimonadales bacterium]|nr:MBL fold metallo-hydrolase [Candidatus Saccharimonadales bacterium]
MSESTTRVLAPNPSVFTGQGTNTYLVGGERTLICIDPGPDDVAHLEAIIAAAAARTARIATIVLTHSHPDHRPLASRLAVLTGATVRCFDPSAGDEDAEIMRDGDVVRADGVALVAVHTPGHTHDHLCFHDAASRALYSGDHILNGSTTVIHPGEGDMNDYMVSLRRVRELAPITLFPGHGERVDDAPALIDEYITHREEREAQVLIAARARDDAFIPKDLVPGLYAGYPVEVYPLAAWTVQAHLDKLAGEHKVDRVDGAATDVPRYIARRA